MGVVYGLGKTQITLYVGAVPSYRFTLQRESVSGMSLTFEPVGLATVSGASDSWGKRANLRGFRPRLGIKWGFGTTSLVERWDGAAFVAQVAIDTPRAVASIVNGSVEYPCLVAPRDTHDFTFLAQPALEPFLLSSLKGIAHRDLALTLVGKSPVQVPKWESILYGNELWGMDPWGD